MNPMGMIIGIVAIVFGAKLIRDRDRLRYGSQARAAAEANDALIAEVGRLRGRVEVLERLAIDKGARLSDEIEQLRSLDDATVR